jgi:signal transduction histidine kinase
MHDVHHGHAVQFYEDDAFLVQTVSDYAHAGLSRRQPVIIIATPEHRRAVADRLEATGLDPQRAERDRTLTLLDARTTLADFMVGGLPDPRRFDESVGSLLRSRREAFSDLPLWAYGEMVDLLWADANAEGALRLEELWNVLATRHEFSLLCAYAMSRFAGAHHSQGFTDVCGQHAVVRPPAGAPVASDADGVWAREVARLQQRAHALEAEIAHRERLEQALRDALEEGRRTEALLQEAVRARDEFISIASHELRNPLHAIHLQVLGVLHAAARQTLTPEWAIRRLSRTSDSVTRLSRLLDNLLDVSRITAGRLTLELTDVDFADVIRAVVDRSRELTADVNLTLQLDPVVGRWDPLRLDQIVTNLLSNALKYGAGQPVAIRLSATSDTATLVVEDGGIGIGEEQRNRLFTRFERGLASRQEGGFGLGLWITRQIVEAMGGAIAVSARAGEGSVFTVTLPQTGPAASAQNAVADSSNPAGTAP